MGRPRAGKASCRCPAQPPATAGAGQAAERKRAQQGQGVDRKSGQPSRQAQDKRAQEKAAARSKARRKTVGPKQVENGQRRPDRLPRGSSANVPRIHATDQQRREVCRRAVPTGQSGAHRRNGWAFPWQ